MWENFFKHIDIIPSNTHIPNFLSPQDYVGELLQAHRHNSKQHTFFHHRFMWENFFKHIDIIPSNTHILDGNATDLEAECKEFERKINEAGGNGDARDLELGGIIPRRKGRSS